MNVLFFALFACKFFPLLNSFHCFHFKLLFIFCCTMCHSHRQFSAGTPRFYRFPFDVPVFIAIFNRNPLPLPLPILIAIAHFKLSIFGDGDSDAIFIFSAISFFFLLLDISLFTVSSSSNTHFHLPSSFLRHQFQRHYRKKKRPNLKKTCQKYFLHSQHLHIQCDYIRGI